MGLFDDFGEAQIFAAVERIKAQNGLGKGSGSRRCEYCEHSEESSPALYCSNRGCPVLQNQICEDFESRRTPSSQAQVNSPSPSYTPSLSRSSSTARPTSRSSSAKSSREFLHRVGGGTIGFIGGGIITVIIMQIFFAVIGHHSSLEPFVLFGAALLFCLGGLYGGWTGEADFNRKLEYGVGIIIIIVTVGAAISKCS